MVGGRSTELICDNVKLLVVSEGQTTLSYAGASHFDFRLNSVLIRRFPASEEGLEGCGNNTSALILSNPQNEGPPPARHALSECLYAPFLSRARHHQASTSRHLCFLFDGVLSLHPQAAGYEAPIADNVPRCFRTSIGPRNRLHTLLTSLARPS